jgi:hypothetical protein
MKSTIDPDREARIGDLAPGSDFHLEPWSARGTRQHRVLDRT